MAWELSDTDYPIGTEHAAQDAISAIDSIRYLRKWIDDRIDAYRSEFGPFHNESPAGRGYVARTIRYHEDHGLVQCGSAPSYFGGLWSLATCKKPMRGEPTGDSSFNPNHPFRKYFMPASEGSGFRPRRPVLVFTFSSRAKSYDPIGSEYGNALASVAIVTHGFESMGKYGAFLQNEFDGATVDYRLSHGDNEIARNRGDCHVNPETGEVRYPPDDHQHGKADAACGCGHNPAAEDHVDNSTHHVKCVSLPGYWIAWQDPELRMDPDNRFRTTRMTPEDIPERIVPLA